MGVSSRPDHEGSPLPVIAALSQIKPPVRPDAARRSALGGVAPDQGHAREAT